MIAHHGDTPLHRSEPRTNPGRAISNAAFLALRSALQGCYRHQPADGELRRALRLLCDAGRREGAQVEQLLIVVKGALTSAADACAVPPGPERDAFARRAISMCIQEFYADVNGAPVERAVIDDRAPVIPARG